MGEKIYTCPRCGNKDPRYIGIRNGQPYCRRCIMFRGKEADPSFSPKGGISLTLSYPLSKKQEEISRRTKELLLSGHNVFLNAVTGAGKTELVYASMEAYLKLGKRVGFATPRKDVVVDLKPRIEEAFPSARVVAVYGEHNTLLEGDILVLTTHQLFRYVCYFDLLIVDEIDAFPYRGDEVLHAFFKRSLRGQYVLLSATPDKEDLNAIKKDSGVVLSLSERYHGGDLPLPVFCPASYYPSFFLCAHHLRRFKKENFPVFIFVPTIEIGRKLFFFLRLLFRGGSFVSSKESLRRVDIEKFKKGEFQYLVTTSILERGVTVRNLQVIVFSADHDLYTSSTLIQIAGRVGRKVGATRGEVLFIGEVKTTSIDTTIQTIDRTNRRKNNGE
ncbi:MAG: DEAD/DEAH box helicase [Bacilli bacterium]